MKITFTYQVEGEKEPRIMYIDPVDYYDPIDHRENYWDDGIEKFVFPHEYVKTPVAQLKWLTVLIAMKNKARVSRCQYIDGEKTMMHHTIDEDGEEEIIVSTQLPDQSWHTTRILKPPTKSWAVYVDSIDSDIQVDDKYPSNNLCKRWSFKDLKGFSNIFPKDL